MPSLQEPLIIAIGTRPVGVLPRMLNRHGLVTGATGTGKTVTLRVLAEQFSDAGIPVLLADIKGDLSGLALSGVETPKVAERIARLELTDFTYAGVPAIFWDAFGAAGHPVRTTVTEVGPLLFSRILDLNEVQSGVLAAVFAIADDAGLLLLDLKDLRAVLAHVSERASEYRARYGTLAPSSIGAIQRGLLALEQQGGDALFGEPALRLDDLMRIARDGRGTVSILAADRLMQAPRLYSTLLLYLLSEFYENLPEVGDPEMPRIVVFFDEAHLLFTDAPKVLLDRIEQMVRLIRSKGVGVWFVTQSPLDIPETVLGQLGNRVQHALRAFTPKDQRAVKTAAETLRPNPEARRGRCDHRARGRGGPRLGPRRERGPDAGRACVRRAAAEPPRPALERGARGGPPGLARGRALRGGRGPGVGLRGPRGAGARGGAAGDAPGEVRGPAGRALLPQPEPAGHGRGDRDLRPECGARDRQPARPPAHPRPPRIGGPEPVSVASTPPPEVSTTSRPEAARSVERGGWRARA